MRMITISRSRPSRLVFHRTVLEWLNQLSASAGALSSMRYMLISFPRRPERYFSIDLGQFGVVLLLNQGNAGHALPFPFVMTGCPGHACLFHRDSRSV